MHSLFNYLLRSCNNTAWASLHRWWRLYRGLFFTVHLYLARSLWVWTYGVLLFDVSSISAKCTSSLLGYIIQTWFFTCSRDGSVWYLMRHQWFFSLRFCQWVTYLALSGNLFNIFVDAWPEDRGFCSEFCFLHAHVRIVKLFQDILLHWCGNHYPSPFENYAVFHWELISVSPISS